MEFIHKKEATQIARRAFIKRGLYGLGYLLLGGLSACNNFSPLPFDTGSTVHTPLGCRELLERDPEGLC